MSRYLSVESRYQPLVSKLPETIVFGDPADVDDQVRDTPTIDPPKPPTET